MIIKSLTQLRKENNITQKELARQIGLKPSTISMYESGKRIPSLKTALKISSYFNIPIEQIKFGSD